MSNRLKNIGIIGHIPSGITTTTERLLMQEANKGLGVVLVDEKPRGLTISDLVEMKVKETQQMLVTINESHPIEFRKTKKKKVVWRKGKKRTI